MAVASQRGGTQEPWFFDHGAQFFTVRSDEFCSFVDVETTSDWRPIIEGEKSPPSDWRIGAPSMNSFLKEHSAGLDITLNTHVTSILYRDDKWRLTCLGDVEEVHAGYVLVTAPAKQVAALTEFSPKLQQHLATVEIAPCWAAMLVFSDAVAPPFDVYRSKTHSLAWLARNGSKAGRPGAPNCWVVHASPEWSRRNLEMTKEDALETLKQLACHALDCDAAAVLHAAAHRWRYAKTVVPAGQPFLRDETGTVFAAGDWCTGARIEDAFLSGTAAAEALCEKIGQASD